MQTLKFEYVYDDTASIPAGRKPGKRNKFNPPDPISGRVGDVR